jgi:hypothetical protein
VFIDDILKEQNETQPQNPAVLVADLNRMIKKFSSLHKKTKDDKHTFDEIISGVIYSRYVGVLLELKAIDYFTSDKRYKLFRFKNSFYEYRKFSRFS